MITDYTAKNGLLFKGNDLIGLPQADMIARDHGFLYAERMVNALESIQTKVKQEIETVLKEDWFNTMTTSDLQGFCMARAMLIMKNEGIEDWNESIKVMHLSDRILEGIYEAVNPF